LWLFRWPPAPPLGGEELSTRLYIRPEECDAIVSDLQRRGFVRRGENDTQGVQYCAGHAEVDQLIEQLAMVYQQRRVAVITQIYSKPQKKVQTFADAFRFRKEQ
jgi:hypothetical protein